MIPPHDTTLQSATELGLVATLTQLTHLNLAFNQLSHLRGLQQLSNLQHLNVMNNQISTLGPITDLTCLTSLNVSHNVLSSLSGIDRLTNLVELKIHDNRLSKAAEVMQLTTLPSLASLAIQKNPICASNWRLATLAALTQLQVRAPVSTCY